MSALQPDFFVDAIDRKFIKDNDELAQIVAALPSSVTLKPYEVAQVLHVSEDTVYAWIRAYEFTYIDLSTGSKTYYGINRSSFLEFLRRRVNRVR